MIAPQLKTYCIYNIPYMFGRVKRKKPQAFGLRLRCGLANGQLAPKKLDITASLSAGS